MLFELRRCGTVDLHVMVYTTYATFTDTVHSNSDSGLLSLSLYDFTLLRLYCNLRGRGFR